MMRRVYWNRWLSAFICMLFIAALLPVNLVSAADQSLVSAGGTLTVNTENDTITPDTFSACAKPWALPRAL